MTIEFHCPVCRKLLRTNDNKAGVQANCPACGGTVTVPDKTVPGVPPDLPDTPASPPPPPQPSGSFDSLFGGSSDFDGSYRRRQPAGDAAGEEIPTAASRDEYEDFDAEPEAAFRPSPSSRTCPVCGAANPRTAAQCSGCGEPFVSARPLKSRGSDFEYAGFWRRFAAAFIDGLIVGIPLTAILFGLFFALAMGMGPRALDDLIEVLENPAINFASNFLGLLLVWPYFALMESSSRQATLGKMALGIIVTDMRGRRLSFGRATGRHFAKFISSWCCNLGYIWAGISEQKQAWHDSIADCLVICKPR